MWERGFGVVPVVDRDGRVLGMITDRDICMAASTKGLRVEELLVRSIMTMPPNNCHPDYPISGVLRVIREGRIRRVPIVEGDGRVAGISSMTNVPIETNRDRTRGAQQIGAGAMIATLATICEYQMRSAVEA